MGGNLALDGRMIKTTTRFVLLFPHADNVDLRVVDDLLDEITKFADCVHHIYQNKNHSIYFTLSPGHAPCIITLLVCDALGLKSTDVWMKLLE